MNVVEVKGVTKSFKDHFWTKKKTILAGIDFSVEEGSIYGFLGPNGAGKTTVIKILVGLLSPSSGNAEVLGHNVSTVNFKKDVGYLPENPYFYDYLKAHEFLRFYGELFSIDKKILNERVEELLNDVGLYGKRDLALRKFSKGMLQRIGLAQALINDPKLLILDEPMSGLDPIGRKTVRDIILKYAKKGKTIFFSSHILSDVEAICEQVSIIVEGKIKNSGYMRDLLNPKTHYHEIHIDQLKEEMLKGELLEKTEKSQRGKNLVLKAYSDEELKDLSEFLLKNEIKIHSILPVKETLDDLFVKRVEE